jgi:hypothetical protein
MDDTRAMSRPVAVVGAALALALAVLGLLVGLGQTTIHYSLPTPAGGVSRHTAVYGPGVVAASVAGLAVVVSAVWLVLAALGRAGKRMVFIVIGLLVVDLVVLAVVLGLSRPTF